MTDKFIKKVKTDTYGKIVYDRELYPESILRVFKYYTFDNENNGLNKKYTEKYLLNVKNSNGNLRINNLSSIQKYLVLGEELDGLDGLEYFTLKETQIEGNNKLGFIEKSYLKNDLTKSNFGNIEGEFSYEKHIMIHLSDNVSLCIIYYKESDEMGKLLGNVEKYRIEFHINKDITDEEHETLKLELENFLIFYYNLEGDNVEKLEIVKINNVLKKCGDNLDIIGSNNKYIKIDEIMGDMFDFEDGAFGQLYEIGGRFGLVLVESDGSVYLVDYNQEVAYLGTENEMKDCLFSCYTKTIIDTTTGEKRNMIFICDILKKDGKKFSGNRVKLLKTLSFISNERLVVLQPIVGRNIHRVSRELLGMVGKKKSGLLFTSKNGENRIWSPLKTMKFLVGKKKEAGKDIVRSIIDPKNGQLVEFKELGLKCYNDDKIVNFSLNDEYGNNSLYGEGNALINYNRGIVIKNFNGEIEKIKDNMVVDFLYQGRGSGLNAVFTLWKPVNIDWFNTFKHQKEEGGVGNLKDIREMMIPFFEGINNEMIITGDGLPDKLSVKDLSDFDVETTDKTDELANEAFVSLVSKEVSEEQTIVRDYINPVFNKLGGFKDEAMERTISYFNPVSIVAGLTGLLEKDEDNMMIAFGSKTYNLPTSLTGDVEIENDDDEDENNIVEVLSFNDKLIYPDYEIAKKHYGKKLLEKQMISKYSWNFCLSVLNLGHMFGEIKLLRIFLQNMNDMLERNGKFAVIFLDGSFLFEELDDKDKLVGIEIEGENKWEIEKEYDVKSFAVKNAFGQKINVEHRDLDLLKDQYLVQPEIFAKHCKEYEFELEHNFMLSNSDKETDFKRYLRCQIWNKKENSPDSLRRKL